ncbi:MAG TPA: O-antigen ligase family protein [Candidatus Omnitrophota bacterium]|nr:O-antigen ligase family protein [Candidatus Omnitrophota bacterium]HRZ15168.1 O-antigen ligase family protein [Candidatus Omnitrophota bacterium]
MSFRSALLQGLDYVLLVDLAFFMGLGIIDKKISKVCFCIALSVFIVIKLLRAGKRFFSAFLENTPLNLPIFLFLLSSALSVFISPSGDHAQEIWLWRYVPYFFFFHFGAYLGKREPFFKCLLIAFLTGVVIVSLGGIRDVWVAKQFSRMFTSFGSISLFGAADYFLYSLPFFIAVSIYHAKVPVRLLATLAVVPVLVAFFYHYARNTWIALPLAVLIVAFLNDKKKSVPLIILITYISVVFFIPLLRTRLFSLETISPGTWGRINIWKAAFTIFTQYPVFGAGPGSCELIMRQMVSSAEVYKDVTLHAHPHNMYLEIMAETGLVGLVTFLSIFVVYFKHIIAEFKRRFNLIHCAFLIMVISVLIAELVSSSILVGVYLASLFWFMMGLSLGWYAHTRVPKE